MQGNMPAMTLFVLLTTSASGCEFCDSPEPFIPAGPSAVSLEPRGQENEIIGPIVPPGDLEEEVKPVPAPAPSPVPPADPSVTASVLREWSPYLVVHSPDEALRAYQEAIPELMANGALKGVRIEIIKSEGRNRVNAWLSSVVPDTLWILGNHYLFEPDIEAVVDQIFNWYPNIHYLQVGNELTTIIPRTEPQIPIEMYMNVLKRIYIHVQRHYPGTVLVSQSTFGEANAGSAEMERMVRLGLREFPPDKLIIGINVYSAAEAMEYSYAVNGLLRGYRIWITETGVNESTQHISYVLRTYPIIRNTLRAERIYWFCLYCGEPQPGFSQQDHSGFGLIRDIRAPTIWTSPLYDILSGRQG